MSSRSTVMAAPPLALSPGSLYALGADVPLDGGLSWAPARPGRVQFVNAYLLLEGERGLLIDTGLALHEDVVLEQLAQIVPDGTTLTIFLTRAEMDCLSNLGPIAGRFTVDGVMTGGSMNPFDAFDDVPCVGSSAAHFGIEQTDRGGLSMVRTSNLDLGPDRTVVVITPVFRLLSTFWLFDAKTGTLFTSDMFGHTDSGPGHERAVASRDQDESTLESVARHLFSKFWWLADAETGRLRSDLDAIFEEFQPDAIAPTHGRILAGREVVSRHREMLDTILADPARFVER
jgi:flavorubredoxin